MFPGVKQKKQDQKKPRLTGLKKTTNKKLVGSKVKKQTKNCREIISTETALLMGRSYQKHRGSRHADVVTWKKKKGGNPEC